MSITIPISGHKQTIRRMLRSIPSVLAGRSGDSDGIARTFKTLLAVNLFGKISEAYAVKSAGGTDDLNDKWPPLKRETIAQRPVNNAEKKKFGITGKRERGLLTPSENKKWKAIFATVFRRLSVRGVSESEAKATAAKIAWSVLKREGAMTKLAVLGSRNVLINRVTDRLFRSLSVGSFLFARRGSVNYRPHPDQVLEVDRGGEFVMGTRVPYAKYVHKKRRLWPSHIGKWVVASLDRAAGEIGRMMR